MFTGKYWVYKYVYPCVFMCVCVCYIMLFLNLKTVCCQKLLPKSQTTVLTIAEY